MCQHLSAELDRGCALYELSTDSDATHSGATHDEVSPEEEQENTRDEIENLTTYSAQRYWDAATLEELPPDLTRAAREEELDFMHDWEVWDVVPISESWVGRGRIPPRYGTD